MERQIVQELTWARTCPEEVVLALRERLRHYRGKEYFPPERGRSCVQTKEGSKVVEEAIAYVQEPRARRGVGDVSEQGLALAGEDHITDLGQVGAASHFSSDGTSAEERLLRYGTFAGFGECLWYGSTEADAKSIVLDLIVDDGVPSRGHRIGVFNPSYTCVGVAYGPHVTFGSIAALEFAHGWVGNPPIIASRAQAGPLQIPKEILAKAKAKVQTNWKLGVCKICSEPIHGGKVVELPALGKLHAACFCCQVCSVKLTGVPYKMHQQTPLCETCYGEKHGERCAACCKAIIGSMMKCSLGSFHIDCATCASCGTKIGKGPFSTAGGSLSCQACTQGASSTVPVGKGRPRSTSSSAAAAAAATKSAAGRSPEGRPKPVAATKPKAKPPSSPSSSGLGLSAPKQKVPAKAARGASLASAGASVMGIGNEYASLADPAEKQGP